MTNSETDRNPNQFFVKKCNLTLENLIKEGFTVHMTPVGDGSGWTSTIEDNKTKEIYFSFKPVNFEQDENLMSFIFRLNRMIVNLYKENEELKSQVCSLVL